jgi:hypothetical protein
MCIMGPHILIDKNAVASGVLHMSFSRHLRREKQETFALPKSAWQSPSNPAGAMQASPLHTTPLPPLRGWARRKSKVVYL